MCSPTNNGTDTTFLNVIQLVHDNGVHFFHLGAWYFLVKFFPKSQTDFNGYFRG